MSETIDPTGDPNAAGDEEGTFEGEGDMLEPEHQRTGGPGNEPAGSPGNAPGYEDANDPNTSDDPEPPQPRADIDTEEEDSEAWAEQGNPPVDLSDEAAGRREQ